MTSSKEVPTPESRNRDVILSTLELAGILDGLSAEEIGWVADRATLRCMPSGSRIFVESEPCEGMWIVATGHVRSFHSFAEGRQQVVGFQSTGGCLDLAAAVDGRAHTVSCVAMDDCQLALIPREILGELGRQQPLLIRNAVNQLCVEIRRHDIASAIATQKDARGRVGCTLLRLAVQHGEQSDDGIRINWRLTRQDVADRAGVRIETAIRVLSDLQRQGILRTRAQIIEILEVEELERPAECGDCLFDCTVFKDAVRIRATGT